VAEKLGAVATAGWSSDWPGLAAAGGKGLLLCRWQIVPAASNGGGRVTGDFPSEAASNGVAGLPAISRATRTKTC
jgi:hypothetical protein